MQRILDTNSISDLTEYVKEKLSGFGMNIYEGGKPQFYFTCYLKDVDLKKDL